MPPALRSRTIRIAGASVAAHALVLAAIWLHAPRIVAPQEDAGPPHPVIPVLILPRTPPPEAGGPPAPIRLHRRRQRFAPEDLPVAPMVTPQAPRDSADPEPSPRALPSPADDPLAANARRALRGGLIGCANADALGLSREEREKCEELLARGARDAPFPGLGLERDKADALGRAGARREQDYNFKRGIAPSRPRNPNEPLDWDVRRSPPPGTSNLKGIGGSAEDLGRSLGNDRPAATRRF